MDNIKKLKRFAIDKNTDVVVFSTINCHDYLYIHDRNNGIGNIINIHTGLICTYNFLEVGYCIDKMMVLEDMAIVRKY